MGTSSRLVTILQPQCATPTVSRILMASSAWRCRRAYSAVNFNNYNADSAFYLGVYRYSGGFQNDQIVWRLPQQLRAGTWTLALVYATMTTFGIYTISTSIDGTTCISQGTIDGYSVASVPFNRTELTGVTLPAGIRWVQLQLATKNASSTGYSASFSALYGTRTNP